MIYEQKGRSLVLVVSKNTFNEFTRIAMVCLITNTNRGFPLHVPLDEKTGTTAVIMCEQVKSLDISARGAVFVEKVTSDNLEEVVEILVGFLELSSMGSKINTLRAYML